MPSCTACWPSALPALPALPVHVHTHSGCKPLGVILGQLVCMLLCRRCVYASQWLEQIKTFAVRSRADLAGAMLGVRPSSVWEAAGLTLCRQASVCWLLEVRAVCTV
jgi:hypothetical protein